MLSMGTKVYNSNKLMNSGLSGALQHDLIERADGFAEVFPEHKYKVVEMLQQRGSLTAMTGDGKLSPITSTLSRKGFKLLTTSPQVSTMLHLSRRPTAVLPSKVHQRLPKQQLTSCSWPPV